MHEIIAGLTMTNGYVATHWLQLIAKLKIVIAGLGYILKNNFVVIIMRHMKDINMQFIKKTVVNGVIKITLYINGKKRNFVKYVIAQKICTYTIKIKIREIQTRII